MPILTSFRRARTRGAAGLGAAGLALAGAVALAGPASAGTAASQLSAAADHVVYVETDNTSANQVVVYHQAGNGTLTFVSADNTGGLGGVLAGSVVDHTASQGALTYDRGHGLLYAVNPGSNSLSVFAASGDTLSLRQVIWSGGTFPVSVTSHGGLVYVLNARHGGSIQGYRLADGRLARIPGSNRRLGLDPNATPEFTNTPGQVAFSPDGSKLIVTTKANGSDIDVFGVGPGGLPSASPVVNSEPGTVPFAVAFDPSGRLVVANAGPNALETYTLGSDGTVTAVSAVGTGQAATCWVAADGSTFFVSNAGSASESVFSADDSGRLSLVGQAGTDPGTVDAAVGPRGKFLYVQTGGNGIVDEYSIGAGGALTGIGSVTVAGSAGGEGIAVG